MPVEAIFIDIIPIAGEEPLAAEGMTALFVLVQIEERYRFAFHHQMANFALGHVATVIIDNFYLIAWKGLAAAARANCARAIRQESMVTFGAADGIEDFKISLIFPCLPDRCGKRLAGRDAHAQRGQVVALRKIF